ncbi:MAG TPA: TldD/PmbA family protein [Anaerolineales bacterium]
MLDEKQARQTCEAVLRLAGQDQAEVCLLDEELALTRFAANAIHQNVTEQNQRLRLRLRRGSRVGEAITNRSSPTDLEALVARARAMAELAVEGPDLPDLAGLQEYLPVAAFDAATAGMSPESRARAVGAVGKAAKRRKVGAYGAFSTGWQAMAVANTRGLFAYQPTTLADFQTVVMDSDSSGQAHASSWRASDLDPRALGEEAIQKAVRGRGPRAIEPGRFDVVLDPYASHDLLNMLNLYGMGGRTYQEGRSWMNGREGQQAMAPTVDLWDDPQAPEFLPRSFDAEGSPKRRLEVVSRGVVRGPVHDRRTAGDASSGHAASPFAPAWLRAIGPLAGHLVLGAGETPTEQLIRDTRRGLYITRFWYTRLVHPRDCVVTGMTRDGVFAIQDGELAYPVKNLRFTQSYVEALAQAEAIGSETRLILQAEEGLATLSPALRIAGFSFTGATL